jgi:hypothetical protein
MTEMCRYISEAVQIRCLSRSSAFLAAVRRARIGDRRILQLTAIWQDSVLTYSPSVGPSWSDVGGDASDA